MLIVRPVCEIVPPFKIYLVCYYQKEKVKAARTIWLTIREVIIRKLQGGGIRFPPPHRNRVKILSLFYSYYSWNNSKQTLGMKIFRGFFKTQVPGFLFPNHNKHTRYLKVLSSSLSQNQQFSPPELQLRSESEGFNFKDNFKLLKREGYKGFLGFKVIV